MDNQKKVSYLLAGIMSLLLIIQVCSGVGVIFHSGDTLIVNLGTTPTLNGIMSPGEWSDALSVVLVESGGAPGDVTLYLKHDTNNLYIAFQNTNIDYWIWWILIDTQNNGGTAPQPDDYKLIGPFETFPQEMVGNGSEWVGTTATGWIVVGDELTSECSISYSKLGITPGAPKTIGIGFGYGGAMPWENVWPPGFDTWTEETQPNAWGDIVSDDNWGQGSVVEEYNHRLDFCFQSYPNPFSQLILFNFAISNPAHTILQIYDISGRLTQILINEWLNAGNYRICWDRRNQIGETVPAGTYFCRLRIGKFIHTQSMVVID